MKKKLLLALVPICWLLFFTSAGATTFLASDKANNQFFGAAQDNLGLAAAVGDFNGDLTADIFIGAPGS